MYAAGVGTEKRNNSGKAGIIAVIILLLLMAAVAGGYVFLQKMGAPVNPESEEQIAVEIPSGSSTSAIGSILESEGLIKSADQFRLKSKMAGNDGKYKAGVYDLSPCMSMEEIMNILVEGKQKTISVTIPEGYTLKQIAQRVAESGACTAEEFLAETENGTFDFAYNDEMVSGSQRYEGFLFPDTYSIFEKESAHSIIQMMLSRFEEVYQEESAQASADASQYSTFQLVTIASLIEREAKLDDERPLVASVIYNRLDRGMKLQMCSTVQYALGTPKARLLYSDLEVDSPYNTYKNAGLPAGPIASPGRASIRAALNPAQSDYLYFVLTETGSGKHNFAATGDDFSSYKEEYLASLAG
ncbi:MAG: endolytic transglycosylase MltG [Anaerovoracaceae bacterium]